MKGLKNTNQRLFEVSLRIDGSKIPYAKSSSANINNHVFIPNVL